MTASPTPQLGNPHSGKTLVFVVTEDWFFASHFLPMARAALDMGLSVAVVTRVRAHRAVIEAAGLRVVPLEAERSSLNPMAAGYAAGQLSAILKALKADIVHCIALRGILVGGTAAAMAGIPRGLAGIDHAGSGLLRQHHALPDPWGDNRAEACAVPEQPPCYGHAR